MTHTILRARFFVGLFSIVLFSFMFTAFSAQAIGINNPIRDQDPITMTGTITTMDEDSFEFITDNGEIITVHIPQYIDIALLGLNIGDSVTVTGYLKITQCDKIILPTVINNILLDDLKLYIGINTLLKS